MITLLTSRVTLKTSDTVESSHVVKSSGSYWGVIVFFFEGAGDGAGCSITRLGVGFGIGLGLGAGDGVAVELEARGTLSVEAAWDSFASLLRRI